MYASTIERVDDAVVYLVPLGRNRYELYSEPPDDSAAEAVPHDGFIRRRVERLREGWRAMVQAARRGEASRGRMARLRDWAVRRIAETVAEQRTLWSLRKIAAADFHYPSDLTEQAATALREQLLANARRHHGIWLLIDGALFVASGLLALVPGPNLLAYYFGLRVVGHFLSWRGAQQGLARTTWRPSPESALTELGALASVPRESRGPHVAAIASRLKLPRLAAFFDRAAVPG
jgi:Mitochondrial K+-H+ exchange-related